jgi:hypothetical protein
VIQAQTILNFRGNLAMKGGGGDPTTCTCI